MSAPMCVRVVFSYNEAAAAWTTVVEGARDETEAKQAFNAVAFTIRDTALLLDMRHGVERVEDGFKITPAVTVVAEAGVRPYPE